MSKVNSFKKNPDSFLKKHRVRMSELNSTLKTKFGCETAGQVHKYKMLGGVDFEIHSGGAKGTDSLEIVAASTDTGVRVLPWKESQLTYMRLDDSARWFFTGPIEGCFIYIARGTTGTHRGDTYVFHVNANSVTGAGNVAAKDNLVLPIIRAKGLVPINRLTYADYCPNDPSLTGQGFVFGWLATGSWHFRVHSLSVKTKEFTSKFGVKFYEIDSFNSYMPCGELPSGLAMPL